MIQFTAKPKRMIVAIAGRRIDPPNATSPRFPLELVDSIKSKLRTCLIRMNANHLVSSGACGADLLAMEVAEELGIKRTMILPFDVVTFRETSVTDRPGDWGELYDRITGQLKASAQLTEYHYDKDDNEVYTNTNFHILDKAQQLAEQNGHHEKISALIIWEGIPKDTGDTTHHFMEEASKRQYHIKEIITTA